MSHFAFPFHVDPTGRTATVDAQEHVQQLIEQLLYTIPGERVNRPTFGSPTQNLVFGVNNPELATTIQFMMQSSIQRWLSDVVQVEDVQVHSDENLMQVIVQYIYRPNQQRYIVQFQRGETP